MQIRYGGTVALAAMLLSSCSSGDDTSANGAASPTPSAATTTQPANATPTSTAASATPSSGAATSPRPSPTVRATQAPAQPPPRSASPRPSPTRKGTTYGIRQSAGYRFNPDSVSLRVGDSVRVTYDDPTGSPHDFVIEKLKVDSGTMGAGDTFSYRFTKAGTFTFVCTFHDELGMTGTATVRA